MARGPHEAPRRRRSRSSSAVTRWSGPGCAWRFGRGSTTGVSDATDPIEVGSEPELVERISAEIERHGPMTFARFMELALYEPQLGYYRAATAGPGGRATS